MLRWTSDVPPPIVSAIENRYPLAQMDSASRAARRSPDAATWSGPSLRVAFEPRAFEAPAFEHPCARLSRASHGPLQGPWRAPSRAFHDRQPSPCESTLLPRLASRENGTERPEPDQPISSPSVHTDATRWRRVGSSTPPDVFSSSTRSFAVRALTPQRPFSPTTTLAPFPA